MVASRIQINGPWGGPLVEGVVWDAITGGEVARLLNRIPDWGLAALSADGRWLAYASGDTVELLDLANWHPAADSAFRVPHKLLAVEVKALAFAPDSTPAGHVPRRWNDPGLGSSRSPP